jgi:predicted DCC family thiol-disulfide oxidoreductase YuxK
MDQKGLDKVVFFDGVCGLCNRFVDYLIQADKQHQLRYAPLQGITFDALKTRFASPIPDSVVFYADNKFSTKSTAALKILIQLGGWYRILNVFFLIPRFVRDAIYDFVAKNRYNWFGEKETCRLPSKEERSLFLD